MCATTPFTHTQTNERRFCDFSLFFSCFFLSALSLSLSLFFSASQKKLSQFKTIFNNSNSNNNHNHMGKKRQPSVEDEEEKEEKGLNMEEFEESESDEYDSDVRFIVE